MSSPNHPDPAIGASATLRIQGAGDERAAASLHTSAKRLLACGIDELTVDLSYLDDGDPTFLSTLAALTETAQAHSCELFVTGVHSPALLTALYEAPLDQLFAIYEAASRHDSITASRPGPDRSTRSAGTRAAGDGSLPVGHRTPNHARHETPSQPRPRSEKHS